MVVLWKRRTEVQVRRRRVEEVADYIGMPEDMSMIGAVCCSGEVQ